MPKKDRVEAAEQPTHDDLVQQKACWQQESKEYRSEARDQRDPAPASFQYDTRAEACALLGERRVDAAAPAVALERNQRGDEQQHHAGDLGGAGKAAAVEPGGEDRQRQRLNAEIFAGADVVERLQERERNSDGDRRPRQWQRNLPGEAERPRAEHTRGLDVLRGLRLEHGARGQIDIRIEHEAHEQDRAGERAHIGKPVVGGGPKSECSTQPRLYWASRIENVDIDIGDDVGRDREWQHQQPGQHIASGKLKRGHRPGGAGAEHDGDDGDARQQQHRLQRRDRNHIADQVQPQFIGGLAEGEHRKARQRCDRNKTRANRNCAGGCRRKAPSSKRTGRPSWQ